MDSIKSELLKVLNNLQTQENNAINWENSTKLKLKGSKSLLNLYINDFNTLLSTLNNQLIEFNKLYNSIYYNNIQTANKDELKLILIEIKNLEKYLNDGQKYGIKAEKILEKAKIAGQNEALKYVKPIKIVNKENNLKDSSSIITNTKTIVIEGKN